jgi:hypothetical protein
MNLSLLRFLPNPVESGMGTARSQAHNSGGVALVMRRRCGNGTVVVGER